MANDRETAARTCGMDRQTLRGEEGQETDRGTVSPPNGHRTNAGGLDGLVNRRVVQRPRRLTQDQMATLAGWVEAGPDPEKDGVVRWRRCDLQARIAAEFGVTLHARTVGKQLAASNWRQAIGGKQLAALGFRRLQVAPAAPQVRPRSPIGVQKNFPETGAAAIPEAAQGKPLEIWFQE